MLATHSHQVSATGRSKKRFHGGQQRVAVEGHQKADLTGLPRARANSSSASVIHCSRRSPPRSKIASMLALSYLQLSSVRIDSPSLNETLPISGMKTV